LAKKASHEELTSVEAGHLKRLTTKKKQETLADRIRTKLEESKN
jgi:hypothetical protein